MSAISGTPTTASTTEIERYVVWPGQACSYMVGKLEWLRLREGQVCDGRELRHPQVP